MVSRREVLKGAGAASAAALAGCIGGDDGCGSRPRPDDEVDDSEIPEIKEVMEESKEYQKTLFKEGNEELPEREVIGEMLDGEPLYNVESLENEFYDRGVVSEDTFEGDYDVISRIEWHEDSPLYEVEEYLGDNEAREHYGMALANLAMGILSEGVKKHRHPEEAEKYERFEDSISSIECQVEGQDGYGLRADMDRDTVEQFFEQYGETEQSDMKDQAEVRKDIFGYMVNNISCYNDNKNENTFF